MRIGSGGLALLLTFALWSCQMEEAPQASAESEATEEPSWSLLAAAENAFASRAQEVGISPAFLEVLADSGMVFAPGPVLGREQHTAHPAAADAYLRWHPRIASASRAGDLGFTSGPWVAGRVGQPAGASGHYVSVWRRKADGGWELLVDVGVSHPPLSDQEVARAATEFPAPPAADPSWSQEDAERALADLRAQLWSALALVAQARLPEVALTDVRVYADGRAPREGIEPLAEMAVRGRSATARSSGISRSRDFAYAFGTLSTPAGPAGNFLEIWSAQGPDWKLALMLVQPR